MSLPRYREYKDSRFDWIGEVPIHWSVAAAGHRYEVLLGKMLDEKRITGDHLAPYLRNADVQWDRINVENLPQMDFSGSDLARYALTPGDLLVCEGGEVGRAAIWRGDVDECYYQKALHRLRCRDAAKDLPRFMFYLLRAASSLNVFTASEGKSTIAHLTAEALRSYRFAFPTFPEQQHIVGFLDHETGKIDALIAEQEMLLALLAEKRQATISHAVTRGLNPEAPMKDSGVGWLGKVPAHWEVSRVKRIIWSIEQGWSPQCENYPVEGPHEWGVLKVGCVNGGIFNSSENKKLPPELEPIVEYSLRKGDLLISRANTRELVGSAAVVPEDFENLLLCDKLYRLRVEADMCRPDFLSAYLAIRATRAQIELDATGASSSMLNIGQSVILELLVPLPDVSEQAAIMSFVSIETSKLDTLKTEAERAIDLLKERRSALIAAAVTGKIDVRQQPFALEAAA
ncbi:hypothetical protein AYM40_35110 [Paraburkholderia phytofirmans OLGA172]|uniref:Type I restriction modification DNA specificity domain-containing protein n=1 Tax=Paraburkholderia phytofirmans OLGA172 TaxID=1417228 RepID=A0A160FVG2_9BURK|nr:restriction endonuclease subunit S [Paraburkholderia phytofirmans]ANB77315.1 hypothetical protein AYM40_35110 [Paraburkholderia phytofirmans OLGA172]